jgi:hypothetical protein
MKLLYLTLLFSLYFLNSSSQIYSGQLIDAGSGQAVPFANIGINGKNVGTASDDAGLFKIELDSKFDNDTISISSIGYASKKYLISDFKASVGNPDQFRIELLPKTYQLSEVIIKPRKTKIYTLGNYCDPNSAYGNSFYSKQLGTELGVIIKLPGRKNKAYIHSARFYVGEFTFEKFPVRLNIYKLKNGRPFENILTVPIFFEIKSAGEHVIDLKPYGIVLYDDFFISLEYFRLADGKEGKLVFCATHQPGLKQGNGFYRVTSQGNWEPDFSDNLGLSVQAGCEKQ